MGIVRILGIGLIGGLCCQVALGQTLYLNELLAVNNNTLQDEAGEFDDWVELYNPGLAPVPLAGYHLTDDAGNLTKWQLPADAPSVPAEGFLLLWLDGEPEQGTHHAPFKLSGAGEYLGLYQPDGVTPVDTLTFPAQVQDVSYGRQPDGGSTFLNFATPTPGAANSTGGVAFAVPPLFSPPGGFYTGGTTVTLSTPSLDAAVYYTLDGRVPTDSSALYTGPISTDTTVIIRAVAMAPGLLPSRITTRTYLINESFTLPTLSLVSDPVNLFDEEIGILVDGPERPGCTEQCENYWQDWEREAHAEYFEADGTPAFGLDLGVKVSGFFSRPNAKKSLALRTRARYGTPALRYPLFAQYPDVDRYDGLQLRASTFERTRNEAFYELNEAAGGHLDMQAYQPVIVFLNGQYHGIYNLMERKNADLIERRYGFTDIDLYDATEAVLEGDRVHYDMTTEYLSSDAFRQSDGLAFAATNLVDMQSLIDHYATNIIIGRTDFGNVRMWRPRTEGGRWRAMAFDFDVSLLEHDTVDWMLAISADEWLHGMLSFLVQNIDFRTRLINRTADLLNDAFSPANHRTIIDQMAGRVSAEMPREIERWQIQYNSFMESFDAWVGFVNERKTFAQFRPDRVRTHLQTHFNLGPPVRLSINPLGQGTIGVNSIEGITSNWLGFYFPGLPITLTAQAAPGFTFEGWSDPNLGTDPTVTFSMTTDLNLAPVFTQAAAPPAVAFNEINFNAAGFFDTRDWVELYNPTPDTVDLAGWIFEDGALNAFVIPDSTHIAPEGYLVLCRDRDAFFQTYRETVDCVGNFSFGLSNLGETLTLRHPTQILVDALTYGTGADWPTGPDGQGATLALTDPTQDNSVPDHWQASLAVGGTPGAANLTAAVPPTLVINEINFNASADFDPRDWIELYNPAMEFVDAAGLQFLDADSDTLFTIPPGTLMFPLSYIVLCRDRAAFTAAYPDGPECLGDLGFGLANSGEKIQLWSRDRVVVDSLTFDDEAPWPTAANGEGFTLELVNPNLDNALPESWAASLAVGGTPGGENTVFVSAEADRPGPTATQLYPNYPNPFRTTTRIGYALDRPAAIKVRIFNAAGRRVATLPLGHRPPGMYTVDWNAQDLSAGLYFYQLVADGMVVGTRSALHLR